jgi:hypothetical protein
MTLQHWGTACVTTAAQALTFPSQPVRRAFLNRLLPKDVRTFDVLSPGQQRQHKASAGPEGVKSTDREASGHPPYRLRPLNGSVLHGVAPS